MSYLIIHENKEIREAYLIKFLRNIFELELDELSVWSKKADIHILQKEEKDKTTSIGIDEVKILQNELIYYPMEYDYQTGIILDAQNLTREAQNAMLKTLEESNERTIYILLADTEKKLLKTILSRCQKHHPREKGTNKIEDSIPDIVKLNLAEKFKYIEKLTESAKKDSSAIEKFLQNLENYYRTKLTNGKKENIEALQAIDETRNRINSNTNKQFTLENLILKIDHEL